MKKLVLFTLLLLAVCTNACNDSHDFLDNGCPYGCCTCDQGPVGGPTDSPTDADPY